MIRSLVQYKNTRGLRVLHRGRLFSIGYSICTLLVIEGFGAVMEVDASAGIHHSHIIPGKVGKVGSSSTLVSTGSTARVHAWCGWGGAGAPHFTA